VPKDPAISVFAEDGVFVCVQPYVAVSGSMSGTAAYSRPRPSLVSAGCSYGCQATGQLRGLRRGAGSQASSPSSRVWVLRVGYVLATIQALGVPGQQHLDAVARALGDLGRVHPSVEPRGECSVPQVVRTLGQR
jgi:hypothetical protein